MPRTGSLLRCLLVSLGAVAPAWGQSAGGPDADVVMMQQLRVEASHADWLYIASPGYEIISRCPDDMTMKFARGMIRSRDLEENFIPLGLGEVPTPPSFAILYSDEAAHGLIPGPAQVGHEPGNYWGSVSRPRQIQGGQSNTEGDTFAYVFNLGGVDVGPIDLTFGGGDLLRFRLSHRQPWFPPWLIAGITTPFGLARSVPTTANLVLPGSLWVKQSEVNEGLAEANRRAQSEAEQTTAAPREGVVSMPPLIVQGTTHAELLPMREIFRTRDPAEGPPSLLWQAQSALFVRWALFAAEVPQREQVLVRLVQRAMRGPITEDDFRDCYGFGYAEARRRLTAYAHTAANSTVTYAYRGFRRWPTPVTPAVKRPATEGEVARLVGDWERMCGLRLKDMNPKRSAAFFAEAGRTLRRAYDAGDRDPRFLAVLGLYYEETGDAAQALPLLQEAVKAKVDRPDAFAALAKVSR